MDWMILIALAIAFIGGFLTGTRIVFVRYVPVKSSTEDLYPRKDNNGSDIN